MICAQFYWKSDRTALETVKAYIAAEFSPEVVDDVLSVVKIFEKNHLRDQISESADTAYQLMKNADAKLSPQARGSWRWRLLYIRATLDREIYRNYHGEASNEVYQQACQELTKISHAENAVEALRPVCVMTRPADTK